MKRRKERITTIRPMTSLLSISLLVNLVTSQSLPPVDFVVWKNQTVILVLEIYAQEYVWHYDAFEV